MRICQEILMVNRDPVRVESTWAGHLPFHLDLKPSLSYIPKSLNPTTSITFLMSFRGACDEKSPRRLPVGDVLKISRPPAHSTSLRAGSRNDISLKNFNKARYEGGRPAGRPFNLVALDWSLSGNGPIIWRQWPDKLASICCLSTSIFSQRSDEC